MEVCMLNKVVMTLLLSLSVTCCFALTEHCPFDSTEAKYGGWKSKNDPVVSKESLLYVAFGKDRYNPTISIICIYQSGSWLRKTTRENFAEGVSGNWIKTRVSNENSDDYDGYFCSYPDASNCVWNTF